MNAEKSNNFNSRLDYKASGEIYQKNINFIKCAPNNRCGDIPQSPTDDPVVMLLEHVIPVNRIIYL